MKYLVISSLLILGFLLVYSRVKPYVQLLRKIIKAINSAGVVTPGVAANAYSQAVENKLIRCANCETWIPAKRAVGAKAGLAAYCSMECLEKAAADQDRKWAS